MHICRMAWRYFRETIMKTIKVNDEDFDLLMHILNEKGREIANNESVYAYKEHCEFKRRVESGIVSWL